MVSKDVTITCQYGLHMLPSIMLSKMMREYYGCEVRIHYKDKDINAKDIMDLLRNQLKHDSRVTLVCDGKHEEQALKDITWFIEEKLNTLPHK